MCSTIGFPEKKGIGDVLERFMPLITGTPRDSSFCIGFAVTDWSSSIALSLLSIVVSEENVKK